MKKSIILIASAAAFGAGAANAHIVLAETEADAGAYYAGEFRVSHGCDGSPTVRLRIEIPEGVESAKPRPKPGWSIAIETETLATPIQSEGGEITERVSAIVWEGRLDDAYFDTFGVMMRLPAASGLLYFPTAQSCDQGETRWTDIPEAGAAWNSVPYPAPVLTLAPAPDAAGHNH